MQLPGDPWSCRLTQAETGCQGRQHLANRGRPGFCRLTASFGKTKGCDAHKGSAQ